MPQTPDQIVQQKVLDNLLARRPELGDELAVRALLRSHIEPVPDRRQIQTPEGPLVVPLPAPPYPARQAPTVDRDADAALTLLRKYAPGAGTDVPNIARSIQPPGLVQRIQDWLNPPKGPILGETTSDRRISLRADPPDGRTDDAALREILFHELAHVKNKDTWPGGWSDEPDAQAAGESWTATIFPLLQRLGLEK